MYWRGLNQLITFHFVFFVVDRIFCIHCSHSFISFSLATNKNILQDNLFPEASFLVLSLVVYQPLSSNHFPIYLSPTRYLCYSHARTSAYRVTDTCKFKVREKLTTISPDVMITLSFTLNEVIVLTAD